MIRHVLATMIMIVVAISALAAPKPGEIPLPYPAVATSAVAGQYVTAPSPEFLANAFEKGAASQTFIFYGAWMVAPGSAESKLKTLVNKEITIPNSLIVPIRSGGSAAVGDIVLTTWRSGSGMQRAIVVPGGVATEPRVRYLDIAFDNPTGWGTREDTLLPNTFHRMSGTLEPGAIVAQRSGAAFKRAQVVHVQGEQVLLVGFAGRLAVAARGDCVVLPLRPAVKAGDQVWAPSIGSFARATVERVEPAIGRVFVKLASGRTAAVAFGDLALALQ
ncbi:MAG: hypothetical protein KA072_09305 [Thermoanaerobaculaceae bacterium]|nr:hypothetical protein [Thermoanaerobaculaceae bacterium]MDI9620991.1 hypothetical protein [Acidobacteriota bacterium]NLH12695.1 hypothetical protein [Holophagae bacterium]HPW56687.1 hypothetical protein [Thermoanaerobaculaceae bacterium]